MNAKYLDEFLKCLEEKRFYDAHDALEALWFPHRFEKNNEIALLKGYINAAVSFELIKRGRKDSAQKVYNNYLKYKDLRPQIDSVYSHKYAEIEKKIEKLKQEVSSDV
ncbi:DUF309 domain-containing protein [Sulfurimonas sp. HSL-1716]|uniref:DUF309 domain-containing protein n=1 Tax=Hydrocurvibacter sulfurireducens TaxID=3131937 RepID=UPI0031F8FDBD